MAADYDRQQKELLDAVWDDYENDAPRTAYADWLDSIGDPADSARAKFIRVSVRTGAFVWSNPEFVAARPVLEELLRKHRAAWLAGLPPEFDPRWVTNVRGMFEIASHHTAAEWLANGERWLRRTPPDVAFHLNLLPGYGRKAESGPPDWAALFGKPWWDRVLTLQVGGWAGRGDSYFGPAGVGRIGSHPGFRRLRQLTLAQNPIGDAGAAALAAAPHLGNLRTLTVRDCELTAAGAAALAARANMPRLQRLYLQGNPAAEEPDDAVVAAAAAAGGRVVHTRTRFGVYYDGTPPDPDYGDDIPF